MQVELSAEELARYSRHIRLPQMGVEGQRRLKGSSVLLIGMGGLGGPASLYLAAAGVGRLGMADFDRVEAHNLQRQIIHSEESVGTSKLESAAKRLRSINPHCHLEFHPDGVRLENAIELFSNYDLILDGSDNFPTRYLVNDAAYFSGRPLVHGSIFQFEGQVSFFHPKAGGPCYRCLFPKMPEPGTVPNCEEAGVLGALCGIVGSFQAMEAIKWLAGVGEPLLGRLLYINTLTMRIRTVQLKKDPECPLCGSQPEIRSLEADRYVFHCPTNSNQPAYSMPAELPAAFTPAEAIAYKESHPESLFLDVREDFEVAICRLPDALHISLRELPERYATLPKDRTIIAYCHHGMRSMRAMEFLRQRGWSNVVNLTGGIDAWAREIDPEMPRY